MIVNRIEPKIAVPNPSTSNPGEKLAASMRRRAFNTNVNNPSVTIFIGSVKNSKIGFTKAFISPIITTAIKAEVKSDNLIPGSIKLTKYSDNALVNQRMINPIIFYF